MDNLLVIPEGNPVVFIDKERALLPQYNTKFSGEWRAEESLKRHQGAGHYHQKWQTSDVISLQIFSNIGPLSLVLLTLSGQKVQTLNFTAKQRYRSDPSLILYEANMSLAGMLERVYTLEIWAGDPVLKKMESIAHLDIRESWPDTVLWEGKNSFFYADTVWQTGFSPSFRLEGWFKKKPPTSKDEVYIDQVYNTKMIWSDPQQVWRFIIGPPSGVPEWLPEKLVWLLGCDDSSLDGFRFTKPEGAKFEDNTEEGVPFSGYEIELVPSVRQSSKTVGIDGTLGGKKILVGVNVDTDGFGDTYLGASSNVIQLTKINQ